MKRDWWNRSDPRGEPVTTQDGCLYFREWSEWRREPASGIMARVADVISAINATRFRGHAVGCVRLRAVNVTRIDNTADAIVRYDYQAVGPTARADRRWYAYRDISPPPG